jgi:protocatechuate 3,4-dioxygenase beta subunit
MCHSENQGLFGDLNLFLNRRKAIAWLASASAAGLAGNPSFSARAEPEVTAKRPDGTECVADPPENQGPFPADGSNQAWGRVVNVLDRSGVVRRDMRSNLNGTPQQVAKGAQLNLTLRLVHVGTSCVPLKGYAIYLWHCDAAGLYSLYDLPNASYLRAVGQTDGDGTVSFMTIFPGCYPVRYPHIHLEIYPSLAAALDYKRRILTSQLAMPANTCRAVYESDPAYRVSLVNFPRLQLDRDMVFAKSTPKQRAAQTLVISGDSEKGYQGNVTVGLKV